MRVLRAIVPVLIMILVFSWVISFFVESAWTTHWVSKDARQGAATAVGRSWRGHGAVDYEYVVNGQTYTGVGGGRRNIRIGDQVPVFYSTSHPWLSMLRRPESSPSTLGSETFVVCAIVVIAFLFYMNQRFKRTRRVAMSANWNIELGGRVVSRDVQMQVLKSLDDIPPELREKFKDALSHHHASDAHRSSAPTEEPQLEDVTIETVTETLVDDKLELNAFDLTGKLPRDFLQTLEGGTTTPAPVEHFTFTYQGPDGVKRTYHSLEEMPPDVRAMYDRIEASIESKPNRPKGPTS
jgi:hypothetical protein